MRHQGMGSEGLVKYSVASKNAEVKVCGVNLSSFS